MQTSAKGRALIESFEGLRLEAYRDVVGIWTIGYGHTKDVMPGQVVTQSQADELLEGDLGIAEHCVSGLVKVPISQNQFDAMVSLTYNIGCGNFSKSSVLRYLNMGNTEQSAEAFLLWCKAAGQFVQGLANRRAAEKALFLEA